MKSKINEAKFTKRIPTDSYAFEEYSLTAIVDDSETGEQVLTELRKQVAKAFAADISGIEMSKEVEEEEEASEETPDDIEESNEDDVEENHDGEEENEDEEEDEKLGDDAEETEPEEEEPVAKPSAKTKKKTFKKKPQAYDRTSEAHKQIFSRLVAGIAPGWTKSDTLKGKVKKLSMSLEGENFLDENGEVLADFKAKVKKQIGPKAKK